MEVDKNTQLQAKLFDFALLELVRQHRESFQPLWTQESWAKFLIWLALNCGLSGERESLELFAQALGPLLTNRMRKVFFERTFEDLELHLMADPSEKMVLVMKLGPGTSIDYNKASKALIRTGLLEMIISERSTWESLEEIIAIPWHHKEAVH